MFNNSGIIPTRVGTRATAVSIGKVIRDHPHACGDKVIKVYTVRCYMGSSPRVWGQGAGRRIICYPIGIIPTRVGTRSSGTSPDQSV